MSATILGFQVDREGDTLIVTPVEGLGELDYQRIEAGARELLTFLKDRGVKNVLLDLGHTDYFGSTALGFFVRLWQKVRQRGGRLVLCRVSEHEAEILRLTQLDQLWAAYPDKNEALRALGAASPMPGGSAVC
jgi:anti-anti-sigma factor